MAGRIPQQFIDEVLARTDLAQLIGSRVNLKKTGANLTGLCPFHNEKTPSFVVSPTRQFYHCFGQCGTGGSAISFLMAYDHLSFLEALEELARGAGLAMPTSGTSAAVESHTHLYALLERACDYFATQLKSNHAAKQYLIERGLSDEIIQRFALGYAPSQWDSIKKTFSDCSEQDLIQIGLVRKKAGAESYDYFRHRIMFPIRDRRGRPIGFGGRALDDAPAKYLNSPQSVLFSKGELLYGLFEARKASNRMERVLVVEGYMDVIALAQHGVHNTVATLGTAMSAQHLSQLFRLSNRVVFCFDGDAAGQTAAWRGLSLALTALEDGREVYFWRLPPGQDPDSFVRTQGAAALDQQLDGALSAADFMFAHLLQENQMQTIGERTQLAHQAKPLIDSVPGELYRKLLYQQLSEQVGTTVAQPRTKRVAPAPVQKKRPLAMTPMRMAIGLVLQYPQVVQSDAISRYQIDPQQPGADLLHQLIALAQEKPDITTGRLLEQMRENPAWSHLNQLAFKEIPGLTDHPERALASFIESLAQLHQAKLRAQGRDLRAKLQPGVPLSDELKAELRAQFPYEKKP